MDKIFEKETEEYLISFGVSKDEINKIKFEKGKKGVISILKAVTSLIEGDKFEEVAKYTAYSPAGDDMGIDNCYINFSSVFTNEDKTGIDIVQACRIFRGLRESIKSKEK